MTASMASGYADLKNELVSAANGVAYAYRDTGGGSGHRSPLPGPKVPISAPG